MPKRIQRKRTKGWRMPENCVSVCRPGKFGNSFRFRTPAENVANYRRMIEGSPYMLQLIREELRGKDLACWCAIKKDGCYVQCHADVLLSLANNMTMEEVKNENLKWVDGASLQ